MTNIAVFPDVEVALLMHLAPLFPGVRFSTRLPSQIGEPTVRLNRISGANRSIYIDRPIVDVDVFGTDHAAVSLLARQIQAEIISMGSTSVLNGNGVVQLATTVNGPRQLPEANPALTRVNATYEIHIHA